MFYRKRNTKDERITIIENKIYREIYILVMAICLVSVGVKLYMHGVRLDNVLTEWIIIIAGGVYHSYRSATLGIFSDEVEMHDRTNSMSKEKKNLLIGMGIGVVLACYFGLRSAILYGNGGIDSVYTFLLVFFVSFLIYIPFFVLVSTISFTIMKRKSDKAVAKQLSEQEEAGDDDEKH
ncbi:hypothetical protein SAMN05216238_103142 [Lentibacillus persicus]|uniref:Uncharacterized protein n=1 Tax=Lentibacillus persicus TaxID=640948 RepID=A0A1I1UC67_9BACI|nr:DUF6773 family protein [Lentibacillus persicus]SFD68432.1 hypothetical protein SAMN05216238_103142 [Lentibacillus persicus]